MAQNLPITAQPVAPPTVTPQVTAQAVERPAVRRAGVVPPRKTMEQRAAARREAARQALASLPELPPALDPPAPPAQAPPPKPPPTAPRAPALPLPPKGQVHPSLQPPKIPLPKKVQSNDTRSRSRSPIRSPARSPPRSRGYSYYDYSSHSYKKSQHKDDRDRYRPADSRIRSRSPHGRYNFRGRSPAQHASDTRIRSESPRQYNFRGSSPAHKYYDYKSQSYKGHDYYRHDPRFNIRPIRYPFQESTRVNRHERSSNRDRDAQLIPQVMRMQPDLHRNDTSTTPADGSGRSTQQTDPSISADQSPKEMDIVMNPPY